MIQQRTEVNPITVKFTQQIFLEHLLCFRQMLDTRYRAKHHSPCTLGVHSLFSSGGPETACPLPLPLSEEAVLRSYRILS